MIAFLVIPLIAVALVALVGTGLPRAERVRLLQLLFFGLGLRLFLFETVMRRVAFFSHGMAAVDCMTYQLHGSVIAQTWRFGHVHFVTESEMPQLGQAALPCNVLALLEYLDGAPAPLAGTALNAFFACWTALLVYRFIRDSGAEAKTALRVTALVFLGPSFLYHTSDTYKDGINAFLVLASLLNAVRLAQRFSFSRLGFLSLSLFLLWFVRHYMVFMCLAPLSLAILGVGKASLPRRLAAGAFLIVIGGALVATGSGASAAQIATSTYATATAANVIDSNAGTDTGSGVVGSGVVTSSYLEAVVYTIAAPFPWQFGSVGLQLGKVEALILYWFIYTVYKNRKRLWADHRPIVIMMATFIIPGTLAYAATMSNVGLIVRQRMPIVIAMAILAGIAYRSKAPSKTPARVAPLTTSHVRQGWS